LTLLLHYHIAFSLLFVCTRASTDLKFPFPLIIKNPKISKITNKIEKTPISLIYKTPKSPISQTLSLLFPENLHTLDSTHENPSASPALHCWMWDWDSTNDSDPNESSASSISPYKQFKVKGIFSWNLSAQGPIVCNNLATTGFSVRFWYFLSILFIDIVNFRIRIWYPFYDFGSSFSILWISESEFESHIVNFQSQMICFFLFIDSDFVGYVLLRLSIIVFLDCWLNICFCCKKF